MEFKEININERIINLIGDIDEDTVKMAMERIIQINVKDGDYVSSAASLVRSIGFNATPENIPIPSITINLSTFGGEVYTGFALCDSISTSETPISVVCYGKVMSMGIPILLSAKHKLAHKNTTFMIHGMSAGSWGKCEHMRNSVEEQSRLEKQMIDYICSHSKFPRKKLEKIVESQQDYFFDTEEALKYKIIDEVIE